ncbi:MAG: sodium:solute symporter family protein [Candidatus Omnitrophica bacterium]|nr:sodium:solute symporter family protein [Candidatus Omnitrophota bacterium]
MMLAQASSEPLTPLYVIGAYLVLLLGLGVITSRLFRGTSSDYFVASRSIGPFLLLMSVFGTTMTAFALVGSTGKAYEDGIGVYGLMASSSGLVHSLVFYIVGIRLWAIGKRYGYVTQIQFFRARFESPALGYLLFPILVGLVVPYLLIGLLGAGATVRAISGGMFPGVFPNGAIPSWVTGIVICGVVLFYVFLGGLRSAAWANALQTIVFMLTGIIAFTLIARALGGPAAASAKTLETRPDLLVREEHIGVLQFISYMLVPLSVGMFPHLFQHWLTARSARAFRLTVIVHPIFIAIVWVPCILIGVWAAGAGIPAPGGNVNAVLGATVGRLLHDPWMTGLLTAGILAAIMSSLDSQFMCLGTMFTNDVIVHHFGEDHFNDKQKILLARCFIVLIVVITYILALYEPAQVFDLGVWCFSGFGSLFPIIVGAVYWKRATKAGAIASVLAMAATWGYFFYNDVIIGEAHGEDELLIAGMMPVAIIFFVTLVVFVAVSLVTKPPSEETIRKFFPEPIQK